MPPSLAVARVGVLALLVPLHGSADALALRIPGVARPALAAAAAAAAPPPPPPPLHGKLGAARRDRAQQSRRTARASLGCAAMRMQQQPGGPSENSEEGSVVGAALLFAGTAIGAGMLALPAETFAAGFWPSEASLLLCWLFTFTTSLVTLEASWFVGQGGEAQDGAGFLSFARSTLGAGGELVTGALFWFLLTSIIVAYTSEGGQLLAAAGLGVSPAAGSSLFMAFFAALAVFGTATTDVMNRALVAGERP